MHALSYAWGSASPIYTASGHEGLIEETSVHTIDPPGISDNVGLLHRRRRIRGGRLAAAFKNNRRFG